MAGVAEGLAGILRGVRRGCNTPVPPQLRSVSFAYPGDPPILKGVEFSISSGDRLGLIGPNATGKTTLFRLLCGDLAPTTGSLAHGAEAPVVGYSSGSGTDLCPFLRLSALLRQIGASGPLADDIRGLVGYDEPANPLVSALSSGQRKLLSVIRAFSTGRDLVLLDEPFSHLDIVRRQELVKALSETTSAPQPVLVISHDLALIDACCTVCYQMRSANGKGRPFSPVRVQLPLGCNFEYVWGSQ